MEPPERLEFTSRTRNQTALALLPALELGGSQLKRLLTGYILVFIVSLALVAGVMLFRIVEVPSLASQALIFATPTISQDLD